MCRPAPDALLLAGETRHGVWVLLDRNGGAHQRNVVYPSLRPMTIVRINMVMMKLIKCQISIALAQVAFVG